MSPAGWERRLRRKGIDLTLRDHGAGYCGDCVPTEWTAVVVPTDSSCNDSRFSPLGGVGHHPSLDHAVNIAIADLEQRIDELEREIAVLALAGESTLG